MADEIRLDLVGVDEVSRRLRLLPREVARALLSASNRSIQTGRAAGRKALAPTGKRVRDDRRGGKTFQIRRIPTGRGRIWFGANPVGKRAFVTEALPSPEFGFQYRPGADVVPVFRRVHRHRIERVRVDILPDVEGARQIAAEAAEDRFLEAFTQEAERILSR